MATSHVRRACRTALADYLRTGLGLDAGRVLDEWPQPGLTLKNKTLSVILAPAADTESRHQPVALSQTAIAGDDVNALVLYTWGLVEFGLQIDAWGGLPIERDELELQVEELLNRPPGVTLGTAVSWALNLAPGLVIAVPENFNTPASYRFKAMPTIPESSVVAQTGRHRATWGGTCTARLLRQVQQPILASLVLNQTGSGGSSSDVLLP